MDCAVVPVVRHVLGQYHSAWGSFHSKATCLARELGQACSRQFMITPTCRRAALDLFVDIRLSACAVSSPAFCTGQQQAENERRQLPRARQRALCPRRVRRRRRRLLQGRGRQPASSLASARHTLPCLAQVPFSGPPLSPPPTHPPLSSSGPAPANSPSRLKSAQALAPEATVHWLNRALCYLKQEKWDLVLGDCARALALDPSAVRALYYQGCALTKLARYTEAIASLKSGAACAADVHAHDGRRC